MDQTATPATGPVDAPASSDNSMASVLAEFAQDTSPPKEDAVEEAVREMTEQTDAGDADEAPQGGEGEVETPEVETEASDDGTPADEPTNEPDPSARYIVKVNGEEQKVTFAELKAGYSRTEDYKAKTMALADERRTLETERSGIEQRLQTQYADQLKQTTDLFVQLDPILAQADSIDWQALAQEDPQTYTQLRAAVDARMQAVQKARGEMEQAQQAQAEQQQQAQAEGLKATEEALRSSNPDFADDAKFSAYVTETVNDLRGAGLDADDVMAVMSNPQAGPQIAAIMADARKWRAQEKAKASLPARRVVPAPAKPLKSDANDGSQAPRKAPANTASRDVKVSWAVQELLAQGT